MHAARDEHDEHPAAAGDGTLDDLPVVGLSGDDCDATPEVVELPDALLATDADDVVASVERVPDHVAPELPRSPDDADPQASSPFPWARRAVRVRLPPSSSSQSANHSSPPSARASRVGEIEPS